MQTEKETNVPNSVTGSGPRNTDFLGLKALFLWLGGKKKPQPKTKVEIVETIDGFWVVSGEGYGTMYTGPYKRRQDAKGVQTRMLKKHG